MRNLRTLLFVMLALSTTLTFGQTTSNETIVETFFKTYKENPTKAYDDMFATNKWIKANKSGIETVKIKFLEFITEIGDFYGYELMAEKSIGDSYLLKTYLVKFDRQPVRFSFILFKPKDKWQIQNFSYDTNLQEELDEAAKAYRLKNNY